MSATRDPPTDSCEANEQDVKMHRETSSLLKGVISRVDDACEVEIRYRRIENIQTQVRFSLGGGMLINKLVEYANVPLASWTRVHDRAPYGFYLLYTILFIALNPVGGMLNWPLALANFTKNILLGGGIGPWCAVKLLSPLVKRLFNEATEILLDNGFRDVRLAERMVVAEVHIKQSENATRKDILYMASLAQFERVAREALETNGGDGKSSQSRRRSRGSKSLGLCYNSSEEESDEDEEPDVSSIGTKQAPRSQKEAGDEKTSVDRTKRKPRSQTDADDRHRYFGRLVGVSKHRIAESLPFLTSSTTSENPLPTMIGAGCHEYTREYAPPRLLPTKYTSVFCNTESLMHLGDTTDTMYTWAGSSSATPFPCGTLACKLSHKMNNSLSAEHPFAARDDPVTKPTEFAACKPHLLLDRLMQTILKDAYAFVVYKKTHSTWKSTVYWLQPKPNASMKDRPFTTIGGQHIQNEKMYQLYEQTDNGSGDKGSNMTVTLSSNKQDVKKIQMGDVIVADRPTLQTYFQGGVRTPVLVLSHAMQKTLLPKRSNVDQYLPLYMRLNGAELWESLWTYQRNL